MSHTPLNKFIEQVMGINIGPAGMGGASAGILGASGASGQIVYELRSNAMAFAREYVKPQASRETLIKLAQQLEGSLYSARLVYGLSDQKLEKLVDELHALLDSVPAE